MARARAHALVHTAADRQDLFSRLSGALRRRDGYQNSARQRRRAVNASWYDGAISFEQQRPRGVGQRHAIENSAAKKSAWTDRDGIIWLATSRWAPV